ncbi:MAG: DUF5012 domain-containing protein [Prevotellaceae bacterium]|nr:DUF5012 domain-containing protein [Prevotellaceae bacterium]
MKPYKYYLLFCAAALLCCCEKKTENVSKTTYYCDLELKGSSAVLLNTGEQYVDPGYTATENEEDVSDAVIVTGSVNEEQAGVYTLTYTVYNQDGFPKVAQREVFVCDPTPSPIESGYYYVSKASKRDDGPSPEYASEPVVAIYQLAPGVFYLSDLFGGYYHVGRGYGVAYATPATVEFDGTTLTLLNSEATPWGDTFGSVTGTYDAATKTLSISTVYATYTFNLIIIKK